MSMLRELRPSVAVAFALCCACGGAQPEPTVPDAPGSATEPATVQDDAPPAPEAPAPAVAEGPTAPYGKVVEIKPGRDDPEDRRAHIEIFNPTKRACTFKSYTLHWGDASKQMPLEDVTIPAGNSRQRFLIVHPSDGDIGSLSAETATVELDVKCGP